MNNFLITQSYYNHYKTYSRPDAILPCKKCSKSPVKKSLPNFTCTDYGHTMAKFLILCDPNSNILNKYLGFGYKGLGFCRNND